MYDGPDEQSMKIGEVYGNSNNKLLKSISSSGKTLFIDFKKQRKQFEYQKTEFDANLKYNKIMPDCQTCLNVNKNILSSPNNSNNKNCSWLITANFGYYIILNFKFIEVNFKTRVLFENKSILSFDNSFIVHLNVLKFMKEVVNMQILSEISLEFTSKPRCQFQATKYL